MDAVRQQLLAGAGLAQQQHRAVGLRHAPRLALDLHRRGAAADEAGDACTWAGAARPAAGARSSSSRCRRANLVISGCIVVSGWSSSTMPKAPITSPASSRSGSRLTRKVPAWLVSRSTRIGLPVSMTCVHQRVGHHLLDALADEVVLGAVEAQRRQEALVASLIQLGAVEAQCRQELLVALADPDDAVLAVDHHRAHRRAGEDVEHALRGQLEHLVVGQRGDNRRGTHWRFFDGGQRSVAARVATVHFPCIGHERRTPRRCGSIP